MKPFNRRISISIIVGVSLVAAGAASAQVSSINSAVLNARVFNDVPGAVGTYINNYPGSISLGEAGISAPTGFANRDVWQFSNNSSTPYAFQDGNYFTASFSLQVTDTADSPRKEAGFLFSTVSNGDIQFIVNTDGHEVVQFGGISFFSFNSSFGLSYNSGQTITLQMSYFKDGAGNNALQFWANGLATPVFEFGPTVGSGALDIGNGSTLGGYFQIVNDPNNLNNGGTALFSNIAISSVPEPSLIALLGLGALPAVRLWRRRA